MSDLARTRLDLPSEPQEGFATVLYPAIGVVAFLLLATLAAALAALAVRIAVPREPPALMAACLAAAFLALATAAAWSMHRR